MLPLLWNKVWDNRAVVIAICIAIATVWVTDFIITPTMLR